MPNDELPEEGIENVDDIFADIEEPSEDTPATSIDWKTTAMRYKDRLKQKPKTVVKEKVVKQDTSNIDDKLARLELKYEGLSDEAIDFAMKYGGKESLKNPYVKAAIDTIQEQKRAEQAVVSEDTSKSDIERKYTPEELNAMSPEEMYKILPKSKN